MSTAKLPEKAILFFLISAVLSACSGKGPPKESELRGRLVLSGRNTFILDLKTSEVRQITPRGTGRWSPDGERLALHVLEQGSSWYADIAIYAVETGETATVVSKIRFAEPPDWSPDGEWLAFMVTPGGLHPSEAKLMAVRTDGSDLHTVAKCGDPHCCCARWSGDGQRVAFASGRGIEVVDFDGSNRKTLYRRKEGYIDELDWSPDGAHIAFLDARGSAHIKLLETESQQVHQIILQNPLSWWSLAWSPTSDQLATVLKDSDESEERLVVVDLNGVELANVPTKRFPDARIVDWGPEP